MDSKVIRRTGLSIAETVREIRRRNRVPWNRTTAQHLADINPDLRITHGVRGIPDLDAAYDPDPECEPDEVADDSISLALQVAQCGRSATVLTVDVDGERTSLHLALLDAIAAGTTWRV